MPTVPSLEAASAALTAGETELSSPPYAACHAGVNYYHALLQQLRSEFPHSPFHFTLCCGDDPAIAHDALRLGFTDIICDCSPAILTQLQAIAATKNARVRNNP